MNQSLLDGELSAIMPAVVATGLLVSLFTAQSPDITLTQGGVPQGTYTNVTGLIDIACTSPPENTGEGIKASESKTIEEIAASGFHHVLLDSYYATLENGWRSGWRCVIDGAAYDITGVEHDSQFQMSRVCVRRVSV